MARTTKSTAATAAPSQTLFERDDQVVIMLDAADAYIGKVRGSKLAQITDQISFTIDAHDIYRPLYDVAVAEYRGVEGSDAKYPMSTFVTALTERGKVLRQDATYAFPVQVKTMNQIMFWEGSADDHDTLLDAYQAMCVREQKDMSWNGYLQYLKRQRDKDGAWFNEDGTRTPRGDEQIKLLEADEAAVVFKRWCKMDFKLNLAGLGKAGQLAWIDAAIHDLQGLRGPLVKDMDAKTKKRAKDIIESNIDEGLLVGGDALTTAIEKATA